MPIRLASIVRAHGDYLPSSAAKLLKELPRRLLQEKKT
jgi:hypothetical protein